jgi:hypothetical protein
LRAKKYLKKRGGKFECSGVLFLQWHDERLQWDPTKYNNIKHVMIPSGKIYIPNIKILEFTDIDNNAN